MAKHPVTRAMKMLTREYLGSAPVNSGINSVADRAVKGVARGAKRALRVATSTPERLSAVAGLVKGARKERSAASAEAKKFKIGRQHPTSVENRRKKKLENVGEAQKRGKQSLKDRERNKLLGQAQHQSGQGAQSGAQSGQPYASRDERWLRSQQNYR